MAAMTMPPVTMDCGICFFGSLMLFAYVHTTSKPRKLKMMTEIYERLFKSNDGRNVRADMSLTKPSPPTSSASTILMTALTFRIMMLSHTG